MKYSNNKNNIRGRILTIIILIAIFILSSEIINRQITTAANTNGKVKSKRIKESADKNKFPQIRRSMIFDFESNQLAENIIIWQDDFESMENHWIPDASWNHVGAPQGGRVYQTFTSWRHVDTNSSSATHSWNAIEDYDQELDFLVSPVIYLPEEVNVGGVLSPLVGLKISHQLDIDTPDGGVNGEHWQYILGPAEVWWDFTTSVVGAGMSSHYLDVTKGSSDKQWRQWLVTPEIDLSGAVGTITLSFMHNYQNEPEFDYYAVEISTDDFLSYTHIGHWGESGGSFGWINDNYDISAFSGQVVEIRFNSKGDYSNAEGFWALDEIRVTDDSGELFYDDGGENGTTLMHAEGFSSGPNPYFHPLYVDTLQPTPKWYEIDVFDVEGFNINFGPGSNVRIAIQWLSDGDTRQGRGLFIDDIKLYASALWLKDLAITEIQGLLDAALGHAFTPAVCATNVGLQALSGNVYWTSVVYLNDLKVGTMIGESVMINNLQPDETICIPTNAGGGWIPTAPGDYTMEVKLHFFDDDSTNNSLEVPFKVLGPPLSNLVYRCDFEPWGGKTSLEDFGFTVVNGGGSDTSNINTWWYSPSFIYGASALLSWAWGTLVANDEVLDESLITPTIDISSVGPDNRLFLNVYIYFRTGHPVVGAPFGTQYTSMSIDYSVDNGTNWENVWLWADDDTLPGDENRWPQVKKGVPYWAKTEFELSDAIGNDSLLLRFNVFSENSYLVGIDLDEILLYQTSTLFRVNAGGASYIDVDGHLWEDDQAYSVGSWGYVGGGTDSTSDPIENTSDDPLYRKARTGMSDYLFDLLNGQYLVTLLFSEIYWEELGKRVFSVTIEGDTVIKNWDVYADVGHDYATRKSFVTEVTDEQLSIGFSASKDYPIISAIEVYTCPDLVITSPNGMENWVVGNSYPITWSSQYFSGEVTLEYSIDAGESWISIVPSTPDTGSYWWIIPDTPSENCLVKISDAADGDPWDKSDNNFSISIEQWDISGNISYYSNNEPAASTLVKANIIYADTTDRNGYYKLLDLPTDNYKVRPEKENDINNAISAYDAAWILQYGVELRTFTPYQLIAGDVSGNGTVSAFDAAKILQYGVGLINQFPVMQDTTHFWRFVPEDFAITQTNWTTAPDSIAYTPLISDTTDNYYGIIYGDVSGNWHPSEAASMTLGKSSSETVNIRLADVYGETGDKVILPVFIENSSDMVSMSFSLVYDAKVLKALTVSTTELTKDWQIAHNIKAGLIKVAMAGSKPIANTGSIVNLEFEVVETGLPEANCPLNISEVSINEGNIVANVQEAKFSSGLPIPKEYALSQNYPNPFNAQTLIKYQLPKPGKVVLKIYNTLGQEVRTLVDEEKKAGYYAINWDGRNNEGLPVSSGIYIYRMQAGNFVKVKKMLFVM